MLGKFIVVEGLEGAGKSSVINAIEQYIQSLGHATLCTREPGGTPMAEAIRDCVKADWVDEKVQEETELFLMYAARCQLVNNVIQPALNDGKWVIGDRHDLSSVAYQGGGRGISIEKLNQLKVIAIGQFSPHLTIFLDVSPDIGLTRARGRGELDRFEQSGIDFFNRVRETYLNVAERDDNIEVIDASQTMEQVHESVIKTLHRRL